jgi:hypothetical protein
MDLDFELETKLIKIQDANEFWSLFDELVDDRSKFLCNRSILLSAFTNGRLYGLYAIESAEMRKSGAIIHPIFCRESVYLLPCFCIVDDQNTVLISWTHSRARRKGFASILLKELKITTVYNPLSESLQFWKSIQNIKFI